MDTVRVCTLNNMVQTNQSTNKFIEINSDEIFTFCVKKLYSTGVLGIRVQRPTTSLTKFILLQKFIQGIKIQFSLQFSLIFSE